MQQIDPAWSVSASADVRLSIIIPAYNYGHLLPRALAAVGAQLSAACELIVIDDGSTDATVQVLRETLINGRAGYQVQVNQGPSAARNQGLALARGEWVLFLDADDELQGDAIATILAYLEAAPETDFLLGGHVSCRPNGHRRVHTPGRLSASLSQRLEDFLFDKRIAISHGCAVFRRARVLQRPYPVALRQGEDIAVFAFMLMSPVVRLIETPLVVVHKHPSSLRHAPALELDRCQMMVDEVFGALPPALQHWRGTYLAQCCLSMFRRCYQAGRKPEALGYYRQAVTQAPRRALRWGYLSKALRLLLR